MDRWIRHSFIASLIILIMVFAACVVEPPIEDVSLAPTVDIEATVEARLAQERDIEATVEARVADKLGGDSNWIPDWAKPTITIGNQPSTKVTPQQSGPLSDPTAKECTLSDGLTVRNGWSGTGTSNNYCNVCVCTDGILGCTKMACAPPRMATQATPTLMPWPTNQPTTSSHGSTKAYTYFKKGNLFLDLED